MTDTQLLNPLTIELDGAPYPIAGPVSYQNLARFENRIVIGDPSKDNDELISTKIWSDFSAGLGIYDEREGADTGRFWFGVGLETSKPSELALTFKIDSQASAVGGVFYPLGEVAGKFWALDSFKLMYFDPGTNAFVDSGKALSNQPTTKPVVYQKKMYIPETDLGYEVFDGTTVTAVPPASTIVTNLPSGVKPVDFCLWDQKLVALNTGTTSYQLSFYDGTSWVAPLGGNLKATGVYAAHLRTFYSRSDEPAIYVVTSSGLWGYDPIGQQMIQTAVQLPPNSANGLAATVWRPGESLLVSSAMGVYSWSGPGGSVSAIGLDRDQGIPQEYTGKIVDLEPGQNEVFALVKASTTSGNFHGLYGYNGLGWRCLWTLDATSTNAFWIKQGSINDEVRLFWNCGSKIYWQQQPFGYANAREIVRQGVRSYEPTGWLITSWFDASLQELPKLLSHIYLRQVPDALTNSSGVNRPRIKVEYQIDDSSAAWTTIGTSWSTFYQGEVNASAKRVRLRLTFTPGILSGGQPATSVLDSLVLKHVKIPTLYGSWSFTVDLNFQGAWMGTSRDALTMKHELDALLAKTSTITFGHEGNTYRTRISHVSGLDETAEDRRGARTVTLVEVPFSGNTVQAS
jgi:hypothetical protein